MNRFWKFFGAFYLPMHCAVGSFHAAVMVLGEEVDCRNLCTPLETCADFDLLMMVDFFNYAGIVLIAVSLVLPSVMLYRENKVIQASIFS